MKHSVDKFLLGTLWLLAAALGTSFWFQTRFGFNIFSRTHWGYLGQLQVDGTSVDPWFYISMAAAAIIALAGLYLLVKPRLRKIKLNTKSQSDFVPSADLAMASAGIRPTISASEDNPKPEQSSIIARPPKLTIPSHLQAMPQTAPVAIAANQKIPNPESIKKVNEILAAAGYKNLNAPRIGGTQLNVWAVGADEVLLMGLVQPASGAIHAAEGGNSKWRDDNGEFDSPIWRLTRAVEKARALFTETLDSEIKITIKAFVVIDGGAIENRAAVSAVWGALDIQVLDSAADLEKLPKSREIHESEKEDFDAYEEYINTTANYFNNDKS